MIKRNPSTIIMLLLLAESLFFTTQVTLAQFTPASESDQNQCVRKIPYEKYKPLPMPEIIGPLRPAGDPGEVITHDMRTGKDIRTRLSHELVQKIKDYTSGSYGTMPQNTLPEQNFQDNFGALSLISDPSVFPWRMNCKVFITFTDGSGGLHTGEASAALIDQKYCITAGHVVYDKQYNWGWATEIIVVPGFQNGNEPYGNSYAGALTSWTGWVNDYDYNHDMGLIELQRPVGVLTGFFGYGYNNDNGFFTSTNFNNPGYPAEYPYDGLQMYYWNGTYDDVTDYLCYYNQMSIKGQSGSGSYIIVGDARTVYAEQSHRQNMGSYWRSGQPRITAGKYTDIANTINNHTPATVDLVPLNMNLEPATLANGEQVTLFNFLVYNNSSAGWTGLVPFRVYFSTNSTISTADLLVSAQTFSYAFPAKGAVSVNGVLFHVPWTTQAGDYYAGVYLDISDYATGNNSTNGWDAVPIHINEGTLPAPQNLTASKGDYDSFVFLNWSDVSGASNYRVYRNTQNNFSTAMAVSGWVTLSYFYDYSASSGIFYYYWVVAAADGSGHCASDPSTYDYGYKNGDLACGSAISLFCGTPFNGNNTSGSYNIAQYPGCVSWNESGPEVVHTIDVYNEGVLTATLSNMSTDLDLFLFGNCDKTNCLTFGNTYVSYTVSPGTYYIVVDGFNGATGPYTLTVSCPPPPSTRYVQNVNFYSGSNWCYDATGTIIIAGAGTVFHVFSGGSADLIAGNNIYLKSGTHVYSGGYLHGLISNYYCGYQQPAALMATGGDLQENSGNLEKVLEVLTEKATGTDRQEHFKVYPNPTTGKFRIEYSLQEVGTVPALDVFSLLGKSLTLPFATGTGYAEFDLSAQPAGIYIVRIDSGGRTEFCKIMRY